MARDLRLDPSSARRGLAPDQRNILPAKIARPPMIGELLGQAAMRGVGLRRDHQPACVLIQPVNDPRPGNAANAGETFSAMGNERVHERSVQVSRAGVNHQPGRLVDHDEAVILINHLEGDRFARERVRLHGGHLDIEAIALAHLDGRIGNGPSRSRNPARRE